MLKSLIWKNKGDSKVVTDEQIKVIANDLKLDNIMVIMSKEPHFKMTPDVFFQSLTSDYENILYRQSILRELLKRTEIVPEIEKLVMILNRMSLLSKGLKPDQKAPKLMLRLKKLELYHDILILLEKIFGVQEGQDVSEDYISISIKIRDMIKGVRHEALGSMIQKVRIILNNIKSITIGANLDFDSTVKEAIILSINKKPYKKSNLLTKLQTRDDEVYKSMSLVSEIDLSKQASLLDFTNELYTEYDSLLKTELLEIETLISEFDNIITSDILQYLNEVLLYYGAIKLYRFIAKHGHDICFPRKTDGLVSYDGLYSLNMLLASMVNEKDKVVNNNIELGKNERTLIITGPNSGGKTVLIESLSIAQLLFQNGLFVPAEKANLVLHGSIFTHFPKDEDIDKGTGRLGEEAKRVSDIIDAVTEDGLVIFNEPYVTTSPTEGLDILRLTLNKLRRNSARIYLVTHYLDILKNTNNTDTVSYVLGLKNGTRTYIAEKREPMSESFALDIALDLGIDRESIFNNLNSKVAETGRVK